MDGWYIIEQSFFGFLGSRLSLSLLSSFLCSWLVCRYVIGLCLAGICVTARAIYHGDVKRLKLLEGWRRRRFCLVIYFLSLGVVLLQVFAEVHILSSCRTLFVLDQRVAAVDAQLGAGDVAGGVGEQEDDGSGEVGGDAEAALGHAGDPLASPGRVGVEDSGGQRRLHVAGRQAVDADAGGRPLDGERSGHVADGGLGDVIGAAERWVSEKDERSEEIKDKTCVCGWGTLTMEPLMLPTRTMLASGMIFCSSAPVLAARTALRWRATAAANR